MGKAATSPWGYLAIGCGLVAVLAVAGLVFLGWKIQRDFDNLKDPAYREARALEVLGVERLPEGYYTKEMFGIGSAVAMVTLTDVPPGAAEDPAVSPGEWHVLSLIRTSFSMRSEDDSELLLPFEADDGELIGQGELELPGVEHASYLTERGMFALDEEEPRAALSSLVDYVCPDDGGGGMAIWTESDPAPGLVLSDSLRRGTPADPEELASFLGQFELCGEVGSNL